MSVIGKGDKDDLRHVEKDVLIPKKMKAKAMKLCHEYVKGIDLDPRPGQMKFELNAVCDCIQSLRTV